MMDAFKIFPVFGMGLLLGFFYGEERYEENVNRERMQWIEMRLSMQEVMGVQPGDYLKRVLKQQEEKGN